MLGQVPRRESILEIRHSKPGDVSWHLGGQGVRVSDQGTSGDHSLTEKPLVSHPSVLSPGSTTARWECGRGLARSKKSMLNCSPVIGWDTSVACSFKGCCFLLE